MSDLTERDYFMGDAMNPLVTATSAEKLPSLGHRTGHSLLTVDDGRPGRTSTKNESCMLKRESGLRGG